MVLEKIIVQLFLFYNCACFITYQLKCALFANKKIVNNMSEKQFLEKQYTWSLKKLLQY